MQADGPSGPVTRLVLFWGRLSGNSRGALLMITNALIFSIMVGLIKSSSDTVPVALVMYFSVATQFFFVGLRNFRLFGQALVHGKRRGAHLLRVAFLVSSMYSGFSAITMLPLAEATAISFSKAFFVTMFATLLLGEAVSSKRWLAVIVGFAGILIIARPGSGDISAIGALLGLISAATAAGGTIATRILAQRDPPGLLLLYQTAFGTLLLTPIAIWNWVSPDWYTLKILILTGLLSVIGNISMIMALKVGEASALAPVDFTRAIFTIAIGMVFLSENPGLITLAGTVVIITGALLSLGYSPGKKTK